MSEGTKTDDGGAPREGRAAEELLPLVYAELRRLAQQKMAGEKPDQTLQATALVHEAWLRLAGAPEQHYHSPNHFLLTAAEAMRRILIDQARRRDSLKRGGGQALEELHESRIELSAPSAELLAVHEALDGLAEEDPISAEVVKLRYFVGWPVPKVAEILGLAPRTVDRHWAFARAWLKRAIQGEITKPE